MSVVKTEEKEKYHLVTVEVEKFDAIHAPDLKAEFVFLNKNNVKFIVVDFSKVKYCDSSGISALLVGNRLTNDIKGSFIVAEVQDSVLSLMKMVKLDTVLTFIPSLSEAEDYIFMDMIEKGLD